MKNLFQDLDKTSVLKELSIYGGFVWLTIQVLHMAADYIGFPKWIISVLMVSALIITPLVVLYILYTNSDIGTGANKLEQFLYSCFAKLESSLLMRSLIILSILLLVGITKKNSIKANKVDDNIETVKEVESNESQLEKLAVLHFNNLTTDNELDVIGPMITHWLTEGFIQNGEIKVASANTILSVYKKKESLDFDEARNQMIKEKLKVSHIIDGSIFLQNDSILIKSELINIKTDEIIYSFSTIKGPKSSPIEVIEDLKEKVLGYWYNRNNLELFPAPRFDSYKKFIEAQKIWGEDNDKILSLLEESIRMDSSFYEPRFLEVALYRNAGYYKHCDSLLSYLYRYKSGLTKAQLDKLYFFKHELEGKYKDAYQYLNEELLKEKDNEFMQTSVGHYLMFNLNQADKVVELLEETNIDSLDYDGCHYCQTKLYTLGYAYLKKKEFERVLEICQYDSKVSPDIRIMDIHLLALVNLDKRTEIEDVLETIIERFGESNYVYFAKLVALEYGRLNKTELSINWLKLAKEKALSFEKLDIGSKESLAMVYEMLGELDQAKEIYTTLLTDFPNVDFYKYRMAGIFAQLKNIDQSNEYLSQISKTQNKYDFGYQPYELARVSALQGNESRASQYLKESIDNGRLFYLNFFDRDWYLRSLWNRSEFNELLLNEMN